MIYVGHVYEIRMTDAWNRSEIYTTIVWGMYDMCDMCMTGVALAWCMSHACVADTWSVPGAGTRTHRVYRCNSWVVIHEMRCEIWDMRYEIWSTTLSMIYGICYMAVHAACMTGAWDVPSVYDKCMGHAVRCLRYACGRYGVCMIYVSPVHHRRRTTAVCIGFLPACRYLHRRGSSCVDVSSSRRSPLIEPHFSSRRYGGSYESVKKEGFQFHPYLQRTFLFSIKLNK